MRNQHHTIAYAKFVRRAAGAPRHLAVPFLRDWGIEALDWDTQQSVYQAPTALFLLKLLTHAIILTT